MVIRVISAAISFGSEILGRAADFRPPDPQRLRTAVLFVLAFALSACVVEDDIRKGFSAIKQQFAPTAKVVKTQEAARPIGFVHSVNGVAYGTIRGGSRALLQANHRVFEKEVIESGTGVTLELVFVDRSMLRLGDRATAVLGRVQFDPITRNGWSSLTLKRGVFRYVSGDLPNELVTIETPLATLSLLGTDFVAEIDDSGAAEVTVIDGGVEISPHEGGGDSITVSAGEVGSLVNESASATVTSCSGGCVTALSQSTSVANVLAEPPELQIDTVLEAIGPSAAVGPTPTRSGAGTATVTDSATATNSGTATVSDVTTDAATDDDDDGDESTDEDATGYTSASGESTGGSSGESSGGSSESTGDSAGGSTDSTDDSSGGSTETTSATDDTGSSAPAADSGTGTSSSSGAGRGSTGPADTGDDDSGGTTDDSGNATVD